MTLINEFISLLKPLWRINYLINPRSKYGAMRYVREHGCEILDIGCGNRSVEYIKFFNPNCNYSGLDIIGSNTEERFDEGVSIKLVDPNRFADAISSYTLATHIICNHNLEHVFEMEAVVEEIFKLPNVKFVFIATPSPYSLLSPASRSGTLNFFDDPTHINCVNVSDILKVALSNGFTAKYVDIGYQPLIPYVIGLLYEPFRKKFGFEAPLYGTWAFYRFETVMCFEKF